MPNHVHGIIVLVGGGAALGTIIGNYKAAVTRQVRRRQISARDKIWHTRYYDHVIRDGRALNYIREYIMSNPARWQADRLYSK